MARIFDNIDQDLLSALRATMQVSKRSDFCVGYQSIIVDGLDVAMQRWLGIEHARHLGAEAKERADKALNEMAFDLKGRTAATPSAPNPIAACKPDDRC